MITLFAIGSDGWALARQDEKRWLLRPPYGKKHLYPLTPKKAARVLMEGGFELTDHEFRGWGEATRFLQNRRIESASAEELEEAKSAPSRLLRRANPEQAARHLDRVESEIENGRLRASADVLMALLRAPSVQNDEQLLDRAVQLLGRTRERAIPVREDLPQKAWTVRDEARVALVAAVIAKRGAVLVPAAAV